MEIDIQKFYITPSEITVKCSSLLRGSTYGQLTYSAVELFIEEFSEYLNNPDGVFYDLGCGPGHMVFHIALKTKIKKAIGIEFEPKRLQYAFKHVEENPQISNVEFIEGDFTEIDLSNATVVYMDNTVIRSTTVDKVYDNLPTGCLFITAQNYRRMSTQTKMQMHRNYSTSKLNYLIKE